MRPLSYVLVGFCVLLAVGLQRPILAQCDSGFCRPPHYQPTPSDRPAPPKGIETTPPSLAVCRLEVGAGQMKSVGTGTAISSNGQQSAILTARHVVERVNTPVVAIFPDGTRLSGYTAVICYEADAAIVVVQGRAPQLAFVASELPAMHAVVWYGGFDGRQGWQHRAGRLVRQTSAGDWVITGPARGGDSGGPVWTNEGIVGVIWGTDGRETLCTSLPQLVNFFESKRYVFPWNAWLEDRKDARQHGQVLPAQPMPNAPVLPPPASSQPAPVPAPQPPAGSPPAHPAFLEVLQRLAGVESKLAALEAKVSQLDGVVADLKSHNGSAVAKAENAIGLAVEAKRQAQELGQSLMGQIKEYVLGLLPIGWGVPIVIVLLVAAFLIWRDIRNRTRTGDPLEVEKLLQRWAAQTPSTIDDWFVDKLSKALDLVLPRPTPGEPAASAKKGRTA